jgi:hypothetical protein
LLDLGIDGHRRDEEAKTRLFNNPAFASHVHAHAQEARLALRQYLAQEGFFERDKINVVVDIGWNGTIQANLTHAFEDDPDFPMLVGYYLGRRYRHEDYLVSPRSLFMPGRLFDEKRPSRAERAIGHCLELFELAAAAPHGATVAYRTVDEHVIPVLDQDGGELSDGQQTLQNGILDYAHGLAQSCGSKGVDLGALRELSLAGLTQLILRPTWAQVSVLRNLSHSLDWGSKKRRPLVALTIGPRLTLEPRRFYDALKESYWLEGCMRATKVPGALIGLSIGRRVRRLGILCAQIANVANHYLK